MLVETVVYLAIKGATWGINIKHHTYGLALLPRPSGGDGGFPSGHTAAHVCLAYLLTERYPKLAPLWWFWAALMAWSRVEAGAHWAYQIVAGAVLGAAVCLTLGKKLSPPPRA
nr:phosphatase PAP2 family protein [Armatimonas rosea]